jgi:hypothetical protein
LTVQWNYSIETWRYPYHLGRQPIDHNRLNLLPRLEDFLISVFDVNAPKPIWTPGPTLDQGQTPHCVAYSGTHYLNATPIADHYGASDAERIYADCKIIDGEPGAQDGTTTDALSQVLQKWGRIKTAAFTQDVATVFRFVDYQGTVVCGTPWLESMFSTDSNGAVIVDRHSPVAGGHAWHLVRHLDNGYSIAQNSWGESFGIRYMGYGGFFLIADADLEWLLAQDGEVMAAVELPNPTPTPPPVLVAPVQPWGQGCLNALRNFIGI